MLNSELIDVGKSIIFRMGSAELSGVRYYYAINRLSYNGSLSALLAESNSILPYRLDMEIGAVTEFLLEKYPKTTIVKYDYNYYGPIPIEFYSNDHCVDGYVFTQYPVNTTEDYSSVLKRGNIFLLQASPLIWRELSKKNIKRSNIIIKKIG